jgi:tight adherence protein B
MSAAVAAVLAGVSVALLVLGAGRLLGAPPPRTASGDRREPRGLVVRCAPGARLAGRLRRAGLGIPPDTFVAAVAAAAVIAALLMWAVLRLPLAAPAAAAAVLGAAVGVVRSADRRYAARLAAQLPGTAQLLASALRAGLSLRQALTRAARDAPEPTAGELRRVVDELALGARVEVALDGLAERVPSRELRVMVTAIVVQLRTGGNLARALAGMAARLEERERLARELRGATAQARLTAWLVAALPLAGAAMAEVAAPGTVGRLMSTGLGPVVIGMSAALYASGMLLVRRLGRVEP